MLIRTAIVVGLLWAGDERKQVEVTCPLDGHVFSAWDVTSQDYARAWGGQDRDYCKHAYKTTPLESMAWVCPSCFYAGTKNDFPPKGSLTEEQKKAMAGRLKPLVEIRKGMKQDAIPGHVKFDLAAQAALLRDAPGTDVGRVYVNASWCARQQGAVSIDDFDDWGEMRREFGLEVTPIELKKNRSDLELEIAQRVAKKIEEQRAMEKRDVGIVKECDEKIAEMKKSGAPAADIKKEEGRRADARGRLHRQNLMKYLAMYLLRRHGENAEAQKWIEELGASKGDNSVIDDAVATTVKSIELEKGYQKKAAEQYERAIAAGKLEKGVEGQLRYMLGELYRRLGEKAKAAESYRKALEEPSIKKLAEEQLKLVE